LAFAVAHAHRAQARKHTPLINLNKKKAAAKQHYGVVPVNSKQQRF
jgi:hypothetical protein